MNGTKVYLWAWWIDRTQGSGSGAFVRARKYIRGPYDSIADMDTAVSRIYQGRYEMHESAHRDPHRVKAELRDKIAQAEGNLDLAMQKFYSNSHKMIKGEPVN